MANQFDDTYRGVPTLTQFTIARSRLKVKTQYTTNQGAQLDKVETQGRFLKATLTLLQPVVEVVNNVPTITRYADLGDDEFSFSGAPDTRPQDDTTVYMEDILSADVLNSLRDVLLSVLRGIPDFATQDEQLQAIGVKRFFHVDRILFVGRSDKPFDAQLIVAIGVYEDKECEISKRVIQQEFASGPAIAAKQKELDTATANLSRAKEMLETYQAELAMVDTTEERKRWLSGEVPRLEAEVTRVTKAIEQAQSDLDDMQPMAAVLSNDTLAGVIQTLTESLLTKAKASKETYADINVPALMARFPAAFNALKAALA